MSYLIKGFDQNAILCSARNSPDKVPIRLGDIIARYYRDPGPVALNRRVSVSNNLGKSRRDFGVPARLDYLLARRTDWSDLATSRIAPLTSDEKRAFEPGPHVPAPFHAVIEDGIYDVRRLYPPCFYDFVTKLSAPPWLPSESVEVEEDLTSYLRRQDFGD